MENYLKKERRGSLRGFWVVSALMYLSFSMPIQGQDYIRAIPDAYKVEHSVVREIDRNTWLVYFYGAGQSGFSRQMSGSSTTDIVNLPEHLYVNEFEIMDDYVYFCGHLFHNSQNHRGVIGRFNHSTVFASPTVELSLIGGTVDVLKLEPYLCETKPRIIAAGRLSDTVGVLIDLTYTGTSSVSLNMAVADTIGEMFSDVAVSNNMIYAASINRKCILPHGRQWFFSRPTLLGVNPLAYFHTSHYAHSVICLDPLIESVGGDNVVFASKTAIVPVNFFYQYMIDTYIGGVTIGGSGASGADDATIDIKYDDHFSTLNVLSRKYPEWNYTNYIYSLDLPLAAGSIPVLVYKGYKLHSLEYRHYDPYRFIATGMRVENNNELSMLHYLDCQTPTCGERLEKNGYEMYKPRPGALKVKSYSPAKYLNITIDAAISTTIISPVCN